MPVEWRTLRCTDCNGHGIYDSWNGEEMVIQDCQTCGGGGRNWVTPSGVVAQYPGGPFLGSGARAEWEAACKEPK